MTDTATIAQPEAATAALIPPPTASLPVPAQAATNPSRLEVMNDGRPRAAQDADTLISPSVLNGMVAQAFGGAVSGGTLETDMTAVAKAIQARAAAVSRGDLALIEETLTAQAIALNAVFVDMMRRAGECIGKPSFETLTRLALKAQAQSRATCQTIAEMKNPRPVYVGQGNFSGGGPQQVVNHPDKPKRSRRSARTRAREAKKPKGKNKLLARRGRG